MIPLFSLGPIWVSDFLKDGQDPRGMRHELELVMDEDTRAVRLATTVPLDTMFGLYWYRSGLNPQMIRELHGIVDSILPLIKKQPGDIWIDIASNDLTLLKYVPSSFTKIGIDPVDENFYKGDMGDISMVVKDYFSVSAYKKTGLGSYKAKVITAIAMVYDLENIDEFLKDIYEVLDKEGLFVMQLSHSGLMIDQLAFDTILSEHVYYYTLFSIEPYLTRNGFRIVDVSLNDTNGGSFRIYIRKEIANEELFSTRPYRDVCKFRIASLLQYEYGRGFHLPEVWIGFYRRINELKNKANYFLDGEKNKGKVIYGYAASTKANTLLQYFNLDNSIITAIAEKSEFKWGLKTVGSNIPICSEEEMRDAKPDYLVIFAWHFISSFLEREKDLLSSGTKFVVFNPEFKIIGND